MALQPPPTTSSPGRPPTRPGPSASHRPPTGGTRRRIWLRAPFVGLAAAVVLTALWLGATRTTGEPVTVTRDIGSDMSDRVDAFVTERMQAHGIPGAAVAIVRAGEVAHVAGYGSAHPDGRLVTGRTPFLIASVSKPLTATAVLQLVEDGALGLDEPVLPYLEDLIDDVPAGFENVTVEHLLTHTSGLGFLAGTAGVDAIHQGDGALARRVGDILARPLSAEPGAGFSYSNGGYTLLAAVVEQVTGTPFAEHLRAHVFEPLGMTSSFAADDDPAAVDLATGHSQWFGQWRPRDLPYDRAGAAMGYIGSSAHDLGRFMQAHLGVDHHDVVSPWLRDVAHRPAVADGHTGDPMQDSYGMGWFVGEMAGQPTVSHSGMVGHFTTNLNLVPDADSLGIAVLTNASAVMAGQGADYRLSADLTRLLLGEDVEPAGEPVFMTVVLPLAVWAMAAGVLVAAGRYLLVSLPRLRAAGATSGPRRWMRPVLLPALGYLTLAAPLLPTIPLGFARHMAPDIGWGLTVTGTLALVWAAVRTVLAIRVERTRP